MQLNFFTFSHIRNKSLCSLGILLLALSSTTVFSQNTTPSIHQLITAAKERTQHHVIYDGAYERIPYPNGDVALSKGVCTDVVIRSYRALGIDLQKEVHEDMKANFSRYPSKRLWGLSGTDTNIDHRRVPNLATFFTRKGKKLSVTQQAKDYLPGDIVTWTLPGNLPHIGIVSDEKSADGQRPLIIHNIGRGPKSEDMLFDYSISGHYRYMPSLENTSQTTP